MKKAIERCVRGGCGVASAGQETEFAAHGGSHGPPSPLAVPPVAYTASRRGRNFESDDTHARTPQWPLSQGVTSFHERWAFH